MADRDDIYRAAAHIVDQYGTAAAAYASVRIDESTLAGDLTAAYRWARILQAVHELTDGRRPPRAILH